MTTRNQKRNQSAKSKPPSTNSNGVDFHNQPIVALPAMNPPSSQTDMARETAVQPQSCDNQPETPSILKNPLSSPTVAPSKPPAVAVTPVKCISSNPVVRDIDALKSGELKVVSPAVSKYFGIPAGPVENLNFSDPKVADFFNVPLPLSGNHVLDTVQPAGASVQPTTTETAAPVPVSEMVPVQNPSSTVSTTMAAPLHSGNTIVQASPAVVGGSNVGIGPTARPSPEAAVNPAPTSQTTPPVSSWAGLFKSNRVLNDDTKMNPNFVGVSSKDVILNDDDLEDEDEEKRSLIGFFNGKFPGINAIQCIVDDWSRKCSFHLHNSGWLVFTFEEEKDCEIVLKEGPYYAFNKPLVLKKMPEFFDFSDEAYSTAPVWIQLPNLPLRAWKKSALEKICSFLGTPLHIDLVTKEKTQKSFARCLVEMDVSKDLPNIVTCVLPRGKVLRQHVLYEETPTFCSNCKKLGHETEDCYSKNNGVPSLYVTRSKKERVKKNGNISGKAGVAKGAVKHGQGSGAIPRTAQHAPAAPTAPPNTNESGLGSVPKANVAAGSLEGKSVTRQSGSTPNDPGLNNNNALALNNKNGKAVDATGTARQLASTSKEPALNKGKSGNANAKDSGLVSTNSFGPLANEKVGNWADDAEAANVIDNTNNKKKINGKKK